MIVSTFVSFISFMLIIHHLPKHWIRRLVGYKGWVDLVLHGTIIWLFMGTSTHGLLQAEAAGICFSLYLRAYAYFAGYEKIEKGRWMRYPGVLT